MTTIPISFQTRWWHPIEDHKVVCTLCPRECHIPEGSRGFCFVRANEAGQLALTTYGRSSGFCIDPIEKKPLNHFLPGTPVLSLGTAGCNLGCKFCQNWDISKSREMDTLSGQAGPEAIVQTALQTGCKSIAFTYNDPTIWAEYAIDIAKVARTQGIKTVAVTAGYISPEPRAEFYKHMDAANVDLKAFTEKFYRNLTQTRLQPVLDTLKYLKHETEVWFEITTLIIPGQNDSPEELTQMCDWVVEHLGPDVPMHFSAFHPDFKMQDLPRTPHEKLIEARQIALDRGVRFAYVGNVHDLQRESTYCPNCKICLIERDWYQLGRYNMEGNRCSNCQAIIPGVFTSEAGTWGAKRQPLRIQDARQYISIRTPSQSPSKAKNMTTTQTTEPLIDFTPDQYEILLAEVRQHVEAVVCGEQPISDLPQKLYHAPAYGCFITLERLGHLRACRGRWDGDSALTLGPLLEQVARETALGDTRFPRICQQELEKLSIDISIMHSPQTLTATGPQLVQEVQVHTHGLVLNHPQGRGLLLPHVATENGWDAHTFLCQLCVKAGLNQDVWLTDPAAEVMTFQTSLLREEAQQTECDLPKISINRMASLLALGNQVVAGKNPTSLENETCLTQPLPDERGVHLMVANNGPSATAMGADKSLAELMTLAATSLRERFTQKNQTPQPIARMVLLGQAIRLSSGDEPARHANLAYHGVLAEADNGRWALSLPVSHGQNDRVGEALHNINATRQSWLNAHQQGDIKPRLTAFTLLVHDADQHPGALDSRPPARAGQFFPADSQTIKEQVQTFLDEVPPKISKTEARAVMLPHAGWVFCGSTIGKTLGRIRVPDRVIVISPKHTPHGPNWSVANHKQWDLPTGPVPIDLDLTSQLVDRISGLRCEAQAHKMEHGVEVLLPFLQHLNPNVRVVPMVIGHSNEADLERIGEALADILKSSPQAPPLLVISSDMNHYEPQAENSRKDQLALDAMVEGDPSALYQLCQTQQISMCGMRPAVAIMLALQKAKKVPFISPQLIDHTHSGIISGDTDRVVGYAGMVIE